MGLGGLPLHCGEVPRLHSDSLCLAALSGHPVLLPAPHSAFHLLPGLCLGQPSLCCSPFLVTMHSPLEPHLLRTPITKALPIPQLDGESLVPSRSSATLVPRGLAHLDFAKWLSPLFSQFPLASYPRHSAPCSAYSRCLLMTGSVTGSLGGRRAVPSIPPASASSED